MMVIILKRCLAFSRCIDTCLKFCELDPCHYFSSPGLSCDAMLKMTGVKLEKNIRPKYMSNYDSEKPSTFITYSDKNNLYGWTMSGYLPYGEFKWLKNVHGFDVNSINEKSGTGYFLEVDLEYPNELRELHNDYPIAPEKLAVTDNFLSACSKKIIDQYDTKVGDVKKLIPNLSNKTKYVLYYKNLQLYLSLGTKLTKIHRALQFK